MAELVPAQNPDPAIIEALETFLAAPNMLDAMARRLGDPATPSIVRRVIGDILTIGDRLAIEWAVA